MTISSTEYLIYNGSIQYAIRIIIKITFILNCIKFYSTLIEDHMIKNTIKNI